MTEESSEAFSWRKKEYLEYQAWLHSKRPCSQCGENRMDENACGSGQDKCHYCCSSEGGCSICPPDEKHDPQDNLPYMYLIPKEEEEE